jgi:hypothetical protein
MPTLLVGTRTYVYDQRGQNVIAILLPSGANACSTLLWGQPLNIPFERIAR